MSIIQREPEPTRAEVRRMLVGLLEGSVTRDEAAAWAEPWITEEAGDVKDEVVWEGIDALSFADSAGYEQGYLYGRESFQTWLDEFDTQAAAG